MVTSAPGFRTSSFSRHWVSDGHDAFDRLARLRQPVIAVLNGHALGGGLGLQPVLIIGLLKNIKIGQPETGIGIIAGWSGTQRAVRRFGAQTGAPQWHYLAESLMQMRRCIWGLWTECHRAVQDWRLPLMWLNSYSTRTTGHRAHQDAD